MEIKKYVEEEKLLLKQNVEKLEIKPTLLIIQINDDPASNAYVKGKIKDCGEIGIVTIHLSLNKEISEKELLKIIEKYNNDSTINGIIVQMPLPKQINEEHVKLAISPNKDVDGFHPLSKFNPCTPFGILKYLKREGINFVGINAVVIGRSNIVGRPMAKLLLNESCNVTVLHSKTSNEDFKKYLSSADLIVSAVGKKGLWEGYSFKESAILVDVGISRVEGKLYGDFPANLNVKLQTPVPGGVGLLTRLTLIQNLMEAYNNEF